MKFYGILSFFFGGGGGQGNLSLINENAHKNFRNLKMINKVLDNNSTKFYNNVFIFVGLTTLETFIEF